MASTETLAAQSAPGARSIRISPWMLGWIVAVAVLLAGYGAAALRQDFSEPDNAMRLVEVRNFIHGQSWFDVVEPRLNPPTGTPMHWARWIDAAIATPVVLLTPLLGQTGAEVATAFIWPFGLLAAFMALAVAVSGEVGGRAGLRDQTRFAGAIIAALAFPTLDKFSPGSFDHHNVELICSFVAILGLMRLASSRWRPSAAGAALGLMMATAAEGVPLVAAGVTIAGMIWLLQPGAHARGLFWFGAGLAAASMAMFLALVPVARWSQPVCDSMSASFLGFGLAAGGVAMALGRLPSALNRTLGARLATAAILGGVSIAALWLLFPACAGGGYSALGADMKSLWLVQISEARSLLELASDNPALILVVAGSAFAGLVAAAFYLRRHWRATDGWVVAGFLVTALAVVAWQIRGSYLATAFAIPFGAWSAVRAREYWQSNPAPRKLVVFALVAAASTAAAWSALATQLQLRLTPTTTQADFQARQKSGGACITPEAFAALNELAPATMLNQVMLGTGVLQRTAHSVLAAPYHRDAVGTMAMINALRSSPDAAKPIVMATSASYVLFCPGLSETRFYSEHGANGVAPAGTLAARLRDGAPPDWLTPVPLAGTPLQLYRIQR